MNRAIWKFALPVTDRPKVNMPKGALVLHIGVQQDVPYIWALIDDTNDIKWIERFFRIVGTGQPIPDTVASNRHIGTFMLYDGSFVGHVFYD